MNSILMSITRVSVTLVVLFAVCISCAHAEDAETVYADDFSGVKGFRIAGTNGVLEELGDNATRTMFVFMSESIVGGKLSVVVTEDDKTAGFDEKMGVLSLAYTKVPISAEYSGFVYAGRVDEKIKFPTSGRAVDEDKLKRVNVSFRYKAINADESTVGAEYNVRLENDVDESYEYRIDFGTLKATGKWQTFSRSLSDGTNKIAFLRSVNDSPDAPLKLVWGQEGEISSYDDGDTLLIDDIKITFTK